MSTVQLYGLLFLTGALWGLTIPMSKVSVSTGYQPLGLIFWQLALAALFLGTMTAIRGKSLGFARKTWPLLIIIGLIGTIIPNSFSYTSAAQLPAGVMAIIIALVPMFALPIAARLGLEPLRARRVLGVILGALAVILIVAPSTSLPDPEKAIYVLMAVIAPFCYGIEGNYVAARGTQGLDAIQLLYGASCVALVITVPLVWITGQFVSPFVVWGPPEWAIVLNGALHAAAYSLYLWMVGRAGSVFASQTAYLVTGTGVAWSILLLSESYSAWVWSALVLMMAGLALVQPRKSG